LPVHLAVPTALLLARVTIFTREGWDNLLNPDNPFVPWLLLMDLLALLVHVYMVYWVYRDAAWRYNRGAPWGLITALLPVAGWAFYLAYRTSPLVEFDRMEAEVFDEAEHEWTDYDQYKTDRGKAWFKEMFTREDGSAFTRFRESKRKLSPEERREIRRLRAERKAANRRKRAERIAGRREQKRERRIAARDRQTVVGLHGAAQRMSDRKQRAVRRQLAVVEQLKALPREDVNLEELIYEMRYDDALAQAREALEVAREVNDAQGVVTYEAYITRLEGLTQSAGD
jgi:hypothetical protein